jgi:hypothetical protein
MNRVIHWRRAIARSAARYTPRMHDSPDYLRWLFGATPLPQAMLECESHIEAAICDKDHMRLVQELVYAYDSVRVHLTHLAAAMYVYSLCATYLHDWCPDSLSDLIDLCEARHQ